MRDSRSAQLNSTDSMRGEKFARKMREQLSALFAIYIRKTSLDLENRAMGPSRQGFRSFASLRTIIFDSLLVYTEFAHIRKRSQGLRTRPRPHAEVRRESPASDSPTHFLKDFRPRDPRDNSLVVCLVPIHDDARIFWQMT